MAISGSDGSIVLSTKIDESGLKKGLSGIKSGVASLGKAFAVVGSAGIAAFTGITKAAIDSYAEYEQLAGGVETLFKDSSAQVMKYADMAYKTAGLSANEYMSTVTSFSASLLQSLGGDTTKAAEYADRAIIDMSDNANKMGTSMEMIQNAYNGFAKQNYTMLDNLKLGYGGTKTEMERLIADAAKMTDVQEELGITVDKNSLSFGNIVNAISVMQKKLDISGTTAKEASTTIQGSISSMKAAWENLLTGLVESNEELPVLLENFTESVLTVFDNLKPALRQVLKNLPKVISELGSEIIAELPAIFDEVVPEIIDGGLLLLQTLVDTISKNAFRIGEGIVEIGKIIIQTLAELIPTMLTAGKDIIMGIVQGISGSMPVLSSAVMAIGGVFLALKIGSFVSKIVSGFQSIMGVLNAYSAAVAVSKNVSVLLASTMTPLQLVIGVLTGKVKLATAAQQLWNAVMNANPVGLLITAIGGLMAAVWGITTAYDAYLEKNSAMVISAKAYADAAAEAVEKSNELKTSLDELTSGTTDNIFALEAEAQTQETLVDRLYDLSEQTNLTADEHAEMKSIIDELNQTYPELNLLIDEETGKLNLTRDAVNEVIASKLELAKANALQDMYTEALKKQYEAEVDALENAKLLKEAQDQLNKVRSEGVVVQGNGWDASGQTIIYTEEQQLAMDKLTKAIEDYKKALATSETAVSDSYANMEQIATVAGVDLPASFDTAKQQSQGYFDSLNEYAATASSDANSAGMDFGQGYANGVNYMTTAAYRAGYNLATSALQGVTDAQDSHSPAEETIELGSYFGEGFAIGIEEETANVVDSAKNLVEMSIDEAMKILGDSPSKVIDAVDDLLEDGRTEVQKVLDSLNKEQLPAEKKYAEESVRIAKDREEAKYQERLNGAKNEEERQKIINERNQELAEEEQDNYLKGLKETADRERKIHEAQQKDEENARKKRLEAIKKAAEEEQKIIEETQEKIVDAYEKASEDIVKEIENLNSKIESTQSKLKSRSIFTEIAEIGDNFSDVHPLFEKIGSRYELKNVNAQNTALTQYGEIMDKLKNREGMSADLFKYVKNLGFEDSFGMAKKLMQLNDDEFERYIKSWEDKTATSKRITKQLFGEDDNVTSKKILTNIDDETKTLVDYYGAIESVKNRSVLPEGFFAELRDMEIGEGLEFANALLELSDEDFDAYLASWKKNQEYSQTISKELYRDESESLATEVGNKFEEVKNEFFGVGEGSAIKFEEGFMAQLSTVIANIKDTLSSAFSGISMGVTPNYGGSLTINVPALARGSVLPGGKPFLAMVNDQPRGQTNIEAPLDTIVDAMNISLNSRSSEIVREDHYHLNETELMTVLHKLVQGGSRLKGKSLISGGY